MKYFAVETVYSADRDALAACRERHRAYLRAKAEDGNVLVAGPWNDDTGALVVYAAADESELALLLADDPYTDAGVVEQRTIREWHPVLGAWLQEGK